MRRPLLAAPLGVAALLVAVGLGAGAHAQPEDASIKLADLDARTHRALVEPARAYLDPQVEFLWRPRKNLLAAFDALRAEKGFDALADVGFLRELVYQSRHFLPRFSDRKWQRLNQITEFKKSSGIYMNLKSEQWRFTYTLPKRYPKERALAKIPRDDPFPLLVTVHDEEDTKNGRGKAEPYPGEACLDRRFPKSDFGPLYESWLTLAPVAARAKFLEDGQIRHRFLTQVMTEFWRRYHVDFDRIVVDGREAAAALAATFPQVFAGLVLRGGTVESAVVRNFAGVPVFVVGDEALEKALKEAGHPDVTLGNERDVVIWLNRRRRAVPSDFEWRMVHPDQRYSNWITIDTPDYSAEERSLSVKVVDTEDDPNTIRIDARGIETLSLFLNDLHVDLDRDVRLVLNGEPLTLEGLQRNFDQLFAKEPFVRKNMNFGWLYPVVVTGLAVPPPAATEPGTPPEEAPPSEEETAEQGSPEDEERAASFWQMAVAAEAEGQLVRARVFFQKVVDVGTTSYRARAEKKLEELK